MVNYRRIRDNLEYMKREAFDDIITKIITFLWIGTIIFYSLYLGDYIQIAETWKIIIADFFVLVLFIWIGYPFYLIKMYQSGNNENHMIDRQIILGEIRNQAMLDKVKNNKSGQ